MKCPNCSEIMHENGVIFFEEGEYNEGKMKYDNEGECQTYFCNACHCRIAVLEEGQQS